MASAHRLERRDDGELHRLAEIALDPLAILADDGSFMWGNRAMRRALTGQDDGELAGGLLDFVHPDDVALTGLMLERAAAGVSSHNCSVRVQTTPVEFREWEISVVSDANDLNVSCRDVTLRNRQEREVLRKAELLAMAERHAALGHWRVDLENDEMYWSSVTYEIHGLDPSSHTPELASALDAFHPEDREMVTRVVESAIESGTGYEFTARLVRTDGAIVHVLSRAEVETNVAGQATSIFGIFQDITDQLREARRSELSNRLASLGTFASGIAHEVNNPLAFTTANLEYIRSVLAAQRERDEDNSSVAEAYAACGDALEGASRVSFIIDQLRTFSACNTHSVSDVDLAWLVRSCVEACDPCERASVHVRVDSPAVVIGDSMVLTTVFEELLENAAAATRGVSTPRVEVDIARDGDAVVVTVADNGVGIEPDELEHVFDPFYTSKDVNEGRGLGLSTCLGILTSLGGSIDIDSEPGVGTRVFVRLQGTHEEFAEMEPSVAQADSERPVVFLIDDEPLIGRAIIRLLSPDHEVHFFDNADDALDALNAGDFPDVIISDVTMPGTNGIELFREVRKIDPGLGERFAFLTGGTIRSSVDRFFTESSLPKIKKPFAPEELRTFVSALLTDGR